MNHWQSIRRKAQEIHQELFHPDTLPENCLDTEDILERLAEQTGVSRQRVGRKNPILQKSVALIVPDFDALFYNDDLPEWFAAFCQAHEYAHLFLHHGIESHCTKADIEFTGTEENAVPMGESRITGYSGREKREREANLFAVELLLPSNVLRRLFIEKGWRARDFALKSELPFDFVCRQLCYALLVSDSITHQIQLPEEDSLKESNLGNKTFSLDDSQRRAARYPGQQLLVEAGPGTGKTRALIGRILHLLENGVAAENILALTFSNKAADEMRERLARYAPEAAPKIWLGTFHAFGLEILRKYLSKADNEKPFEILDTIDAQLLLENHLLELGLKHYQSLHQPAQHLKSLHSGIQRAKDELKSCDDYENAAIRLREKANTEEEILAAEKALETARVYRFYEQLLARNNWLDFGDLIYRAAILLEQNAPAKKDLQAKYKHILVDEFQDVNRASSRLLSELSGTNGNLWIIGDARQTIYRWRGASGANLKHFRDDFPKAKTLSLEINYRSQQPIVNVINEFAPSIIVSNEDENSKFTGWQVPEEKRTQIRGRIQYTEAPDFPTECDFIAREIENCKENGNKYKDSAILARTNNILAKIADELISREIPVLYLGNMFERPEIRDLLSLLSLTNENRGRHLLRLAGFSQYGFSVTDVRRLITAAEKAERRFPEALTLAQTDSEIADESRKGFALLDEHFKDLNETVTAWQFFASYLFDRSNYLTPILSEDSASARQQKFAIYQLLQFAIAEESKSLKVRPAARNSRAQFLKLIRHLAQSGEEASFRKLPAWAEGIDAVRLLTVHAAKGLEFPNVFLPYLGNAYFPNKKQTNYCPLPKELLSYKGDGKDEHDEEERCLFFVALSRAEENLFLSRASNYGSVSKISRFLELIPQNLPVPFKPASILPPEDLLNFILPTQTVDTAARLTYSFSEVKTYHDCPRQYFYEYVLNLRGDRDEAAFVQFHGAVREVISWMKNQSAMNLQVSSEHARKKLFELWQEKAISLHPYSGLYFSEAENLVSCAIALFADSADQSKGSTAAAASNPLEFNAAGKRIRLYPDLLEVSQSDFSVKVQKIKTGRGKKKLADLTEDEKLTIAALYQSASETYQGKIVFASFEYISGGERLIYDPKNIKTQLSHLERAVEGITARRFEAKQDSRKCPRCAHYFICPGGDI